MRPREHGPYSLRTNLTTNLPYHQTGFERRKEDEVVINDEKLDELFVDFVTSVSETDSHAAYGTLETGSLLGLFFLACLEMSLSMLRQYLMMPLLSPGPIS